MTFDTFGNLTTIVNESLTSGQSSVPQSSFGTDYAGHPLDAATGLYDDNARYYDAATHQFTQQDPIGSHQTYASQTGIRLVATAMGGRTKLRMAGSISTISTRL